MIYPIFIPASDPRASIRDRYGPAPDVDFACNTEIEWVGAGWLVLCGFPSGPEEQ